VTDLVEQAVSRGYSLVVLNPTVPKMTDEDGLELVDFTKFDPFDHILDKTKELFGEDLKLYAVGFSAGASNLLRHLGQSAMQGKEHGVQAAVTICPAFDVLASGIEMQYLAYGLIDNSLLSDLRPAFLKKRYHV